MGVAIVHAPVLQDFEILNLKDLFFQSVYSNLRISVRKASQFLTRMQKQYMTHFPPQLRLLPKFEGAFDAFKLEAKDCNVLFASYPMGTHIPPHRHDTDNVGIITQGELVLIMSGQETRYQVGDWYHVPAQTVHEAYFDRTTSEIEFWFHLK